MKCCICGKEIGGYGNNPWPLLTEPGAKCCDGCNWMYVIPARIKNMAEREKEIENPK